MRAVVVWNQEPREASGLTPEILAFRQEMLDKRLAEGVRIALAKMLGVAVEEVDLPMEGQ